MHERESVRMVQKMFQPLTTFGLRESFTTRSGIYVEVWRPRVGGVGRLKIYLRLKLGVVPENDQSRDMNQAKDK